MNLLQLAFRNIFRNRRRSLMTISAVAVGYLAVCAFWGYVLSTFKVIRNSAVYNEGLGHIMVYKEGFLTEGKLDPAQYLISESEQQLIAAKLASQPAIRHVFPLLNAAGLISNGRNSVIFMANGISAEADSFFRSNASYKIEGRSLRSDAPNGSLFGSELAKLLKLEIGDNATLLAPTVDGQMNAIEVELAGRFNTGVSATNDKFIQIPLAALQSLWDTKSVDRICVIIDDPQKTWEIAKWLAGELGRAGFMADIQTWDKLSVNYYQVKGILSVIFGFIFVIILAIVLTSVLNTMMMSVVERTQEIGTLRALGLKRNDVMKIFGAEGCIIGAIGLAAGTMMTGVVTLLVGLLRIQYIPPSASDYVTVTIDLSPIQMVVCGAVFLLLAWAGAFFASRRASKLRVVDALGHV